MRKVASSESITSSSPLPGTRDYPMGHDIRPAAKSKAYAIPSFFLSLLLFFDRIAFVRRGKRLDTPISPPSPSERDISPSPASLKSRAHNNSPIPHVKLDDHSPFTKPLPTPPIPPPLSLSPPSSPKFSNSPQTPSPASVALLLSRTTSSDWLRAPGSFASNSPLAFGLTYNNSPPPPPPFIRQTSESELSRNSPHSFLRSVPKQRPEPVRFETPPPIPKPKKHPPLPPKTTSSSPTNPSLFPSGQSPRKNEDTVTSLPPPPPPPPPPLPPIPIRSLGTIPSFVNHHKIKLIDMESWMLPDDDEYLRLISLLTTESKLKCI